MKGHALAALAACALAAFTLAAACSDDAEPAGFACTPLPTECPGEAPSYTSVVAPIIENNCNQCHNQDDNIAWPLGDPTEIADWRDSMLLNLDACEMPPRDSDVILTHADREALNAWLVCGAPNN